MWTEEAKAKLHELASRLRQGGVTKIITQADCDGIAATAILAKALERAERTFVVRAVKLLTKDLLQELAIEPYPRMIFLDVGRQMVPLIEQMLEKKEVWIIDHKSGMPGSAQCQIITAAQPQEISTAGLVYFLAKVLGKNTDLSHLAIIGGLSEGQDCAWSELNQTILEEAKMEGLLEIDAGSPSLPHLRSRPLMEALVESIDPFLPGISGHEEGARQLLKDLRIKESRTLDELDTEEAKNLEMALAVKQWGSEDAAKAPKARYVLVKEREEGGYRTASDWVDVLRACAALSRASVGIGACMGHAKDREEALGLLRRYRREIIKAVEAVYLKKKKQQLEETPSLMLVAGDEGVTESLLGNLASLLVHLGVVGERRVLMCIAPTLDGQIKISLRKGGSLKGVNLLALIKEILKEIGEGTYGGHAQAAGGIVPLEKEGVLKEAAKRLIERRVMEEAVQP